MLEQKIPKTFENRMPKLLITVLSGGGTNYGVWK